MKKLSCISLSILILSVALALLAGCREDTDPRLLHADSLMEEHPDSALAILEAYSLPENATERDRAMYGLLLTQARYKNFIDETDDSLINASADYFLEKGMKEESARSLFQAGMIRMNSGKFGEAAVSFRKGLDIAHDSKSYMWEGQCARGLSVLYGDLMNGSEQIRYAKASYEAFSKGNFQDWSNFARVDILRAFNNNGQYEKALSGTRDLLKFAKEHKDTLLMLEIFPLMGICNYALDNYKDCLDCFQSAFNLDSTTVDENVKYMVSESYAIVNVDSISEDTRKFCDYIENLEKKLPAFSILADQGKYKEAYEAVNAYRNEQDSVLRVIMRNNVSESVSQYDAMKENLDKERAKNERLMWSVVLLILLIIIGIIIWTYKKRLDKKDKERAQMEMSMDVLKSDLSSLLVRMDAMQESNRIIKEKNEHIISSLQDALQARYAKLNELCDAYFQDKAIETKKNGLSTEIGKIINDFSDEAFLEDVGNHINKYSDGLYSSFLKDFPEVKDDVRRLFMLLTLGFSHRAICVLFQLETYTLYNRKARLKKMIAESVAPRRDEYLKSISS